MTEKDLLIDMEEPDSRQRVHQALLLLIHTIATILLCISLSFIAEIGFLPDTPLDAFSGLDDAAQMRMLEEYTAATRRFVIALLSFSAIGLIAGSVICWKTCRRYKISAWLSAGVFFLSVLILFFVEKYLVRYLPAVLPGTYLRAQLGIRPAGILNTIFVVGIAMALFYGKPVKKLWLK